MECCSNVSDPERTKLKPGNQQVHVYTIDSPGYSLANEWDEIPDYIDNKDYGLSEPFILEYYIYSYPTGQVIEDNHRQVVLNNSISFSGIGSDADGVVTYSWSSNKDGNLSSEASFQISTLSRGLHTIYFNVTDEHGNVHTNTTTVEVIVGPVAEIYVYSNPSLISTTWLRREMLIDISAIESRSTHPDGLELNYSWQVTYDGKILTDTKNASDGEPYVYHMDYNFDTYYISIHGFSLGTYYIELTVTDENGLNDTASAEVVLKLLPVP